MSGELPIGMAAAVNSVFHDPDVDPQLRIASDTQYANSETHAENLLRKSYYYHLNSLN